MRTFDDWMAHFQLGATAPLGSREEPRLPMAADHHDRRFLKLMAELRPYGGLLTDADLRTLFRVTPSRMDLAAAMLERRLYTVPWRHRLWVPMFQVDLPGGRLCPAAASVVGELHPALDGYDLSEWFVSVNPWLDCHKPLDILKAVPALVRDAARVDRFLMAGG